VSLTRGRFAARMGVCVALLAALVLVSPGVGTASATYGWWDVWRAKLGLDIRGDDLVDRPLVDIDGDATVSAQELDGFVRAARSIFDQRFPRTLLALQVGITLALCGAAFQTLFRNPLATPYTLGIASGGSLGALVAIRLGWRAAILGIPVLAFAAFAGGIAVVAMVFALGRGSIRRGAHAKPPHAPGHPPTMSGRGLTSNELLLAGVTMGLFCSAMMMLVTVISSQRETFAIVRWMMGSLDPVAPLEGAVLLPLMLPAWVVLILSARALNQYRLGDEIAASRGVRVSRLQGACVLVATLATAAVVARCGPVGFVGLVVPHVAALIFGRDSRILMPASALIGGAFLIICDWASQLAMRFAGWLTGQHLASSTLPIGVVTALVGVPIFLVLLRARRHA